ncbi:recombinase family protein [Nocardia sp. NPDC003963]
MLQDLISIVADLRRRGIGFRSLHESLDTTTPGGRLVFHVFGLLGISRTTLYKYVPELTGR